MEKGLGIGQAKVQFSSKELKINKINFGSDPFSIEVQEVVEELLKPNPTISVQTSGSTGAPRSIQLQKRHLRASAEKTLSFLELKAGDSCLLCMSPKHIGGLMMLVRWLVGDLNLHLSPPARHALPEEGEFHFAAMVPLQVQNSLADLARIRKLIVGGAPLSGDLETALAKTPCEVYQSYGMTETISHVALRRIGAEPVYSALPGVSFQVDQRDCLRIQAPDIGVHQLQTNDVVELINGERFIWKGRYDDVVNSGGIKLHPALLEEKIGSLAHPYFLTGEPDEEFGEALVMYIQARDKVLLDDLKSQLRQNLQRYELPKRFYQVSEFQFSPSGKLLKRGELYRQSRTLL